MKFLVDIGNSRIKWATFSDGSLGNSSALSYDLDQLRGQLTAVWAGFSRPASVHLASVAAADIEAVIYDWVYENWGLEIRRLVSQKQCAGVTNGYRRYEQLGIDRWAAIVGAFHLTQKATCIIDSGSALTCDVVTQAGRHLGGLIVPGRYLQERALLEGAAAINEEPGGGGKEIWGQDTATCIKSGIMQEHAALVERCMKQLMIHEGRAVSVIVAGGGAAALIPHLPCPVQHEPDLVFKGMLHIIAE